MSRTSATQTQIRCRRCNKVLAKRSGIKCPRCGQVRPFPLFDADGSTLGEQHSDVSLSADINLIHRGNIFEVRVPRCNFHNSIFGSGENPDLRLIRSLLRAHNIVCREGGGAVVTLEIDTAVHPVTMWVDARSHGFRVDVGLGEQCSVSVENGEICFSTSKKVKAVWAIDDIPIAEIAAACT